MLTSECTFLGVGEDWFSLSVRGLLLGAGSSTGDSLFLTLPLLSGVKERLSIKGSMRELTCVCIGYIRGLIVFLS